jgi:hypothetical protein
MHIEYTMKFIIIQSIFVFLCNMHIEYAVQYCNRKIPESRMIGMLPGDELMHQASCPTHPAKAG